MPRNATPEMHINLAVRGLRPSATLAINERSNALREAGRTVYKLGLGQSPFPVPQVVVEALRAAAHQKDYLPVKGLGELRRTVAEYLDRRHHVPRTAEDVLVGPGSKELMYILQLVYYGELVIPRPSWVSYAPQARIAGRNVNWIATRREDDWHLTADLLEEACADDPTRPRLVILNYPANPTGVTYTGDDLKRLARVARAHRLLLLSDEIYGELHHQGRHVSIARYYPEGTIVSTGLSKWCGAGGWRLGVFVFPPTLRWLLDAMAVVASETYTSTSAPIQFAAVRAFQGGLDLEQYLHDSRRILRALGRTVAARLATAGVTAPAPQGAFYLFPDFGGHADALRDRGIRTSRELCARMLDETGVALLPGSDFGLPDEDLVARLSYVDFDGAAALSAVRHRPADQPLDEAFLHQTCGRVLAAVDALADWLGN
jgi:aspartate aminotransferase